VWRNFENVASEQKHQMNQNIGQFQIIAKPIRPKHPCYGQPNLMYSKRCAIEATHIDVRAIYIRQPEEI
jgi:hypothetical protein